MIWLPDTDIANYLLRRSQPSASRYLEAMSAGDTLVLSPIVRYEVSRNLKLKGAVRLLREFESMTENWKMIDFERPDWDTAADLWAGRYSVGKGIDDADLLIVVCALKSGATLVTNNTKHFEDLGLNLENWNQ